MNQKTSRIDPTVAPRLIVVCDFDGTVTTRDLGGALARHYLPEAPGSLHQRFQANEITLFELQSQVWPQVKADQESVDRFMEEVAQIRLGFREFCDFCRHQKIAFHLVSGGFDFYIPQVLRRFGLQLPPPATICCNRGVPSAEGVTVKFPHHHADCHYCSNCKGVAIRKLRRENPTALMVGIGDGASDRCMAKEADIVFARSQLRNYCRQQAIPHLEFETFFTVIEGLLSLTPQP